MVVELLWAVWNKFTCNELLCCVCSIPDAETVWKQVDADGDGEATPEELADVIKENTGLDAESAKWVRTEHTILFPNGGNFSNHFQIFLSNFSV